MGISLVLHLWRTVGLTLQFRRNLEELLQDWCPENGVAALLLEHPTPGIYFPLVVKPFSVGTDYYSLPLRFTSSSECAIRLDEHTSLEQLVSRGRLELTQPDLHLPLRQELLPLQSGKGDGLKVILLRSGPGDLEPLDRSHQITLNRLVPLACANWIEHAHDLMTLPDVRNLETLSRDLVKRLSDEEQDPPYFPILHAEVSTGPDSRQGRFSSANLLSWNCFLMDDQQGSPSYIAEMPAVMRRTRATAWWDDVTLRSDFSSMSETIKNASLKMIDRVTVLGHARFQGCSWWAFARHDKDRQAMPAHLSADTTAGPIRPVLYAGPKLEKLTPANLVRRALTVKPDEDDVIMTIWMVSEEQKVLNIGFRAGRNIQILDHAEIFDRHPMEINDYPPFRVRLSPLPQVDRALIAERVRPVLASAARAARKIDLAGRMEQAFAPVREELHQGSWHEGHPGAGLFMDGYHDVADWPVEELARCHPRMQTLLQNLLHEWTGRDMQWSEDACRSRYDCWHIRALKALAHDRLHSSLLMALLAGSMDDTSFLVADREICLEGNVPWSDVLAALQTVTTEGNKFQFTQCYHGREETLILRFSGELSELGVTAALTGRGTEKRQGSFTRACSTLRRASQRFSVEVTHEGAGGQEWGIVMVFAERGLAC